MEVILCESAKRDKTETRQSFHFDAAALPTHLYVIPLARWAVNVSIAAPAVRSARLPFHALPSA